MSEFVDGTTDDGSALTDDRNTTSIEAVKSRIAAINSLPLEEHSNEYEEIHASLQRALAEIDGI